MGKRPYQAKQVSVLQSGDGIDALQIFANAVGKDVNQLTSEDILQLTRTMNLRSQDRKAIEKSIPMLFGSRKYILYDDDSYDILEGNTILTGSGKRKGNVRGFDAGDLIMLGENMSKLMGFAATINKLTNPQSVQNKTDNVMTATDQQEDVINIPAESDLSTPVVITEPDVTEPAATQVKKQTSAKQQTAKQSVSKSAQTQKPTVSSTNVNNSDMERSDFDQIQFELKMNLYDALRYEVFKDNSIKTLDDQSKVERYLSSNFDNVIDDLIKKYNLNISSIKDDSYLKAVRDYYKNVVKKKVK